MRPCRLQALAASSSFAAAPSAVVTPTPQMPPPPATTVPSPPTHVDAVPEAGAAPGAWPTGSRAPHRAAPGAMPVLAGEHGVLLFPPLPGQRRIRARPRAAIREARPVSFYDAGTHEITRVSGDVQVSVVRRHLTARRSRHGRRWLRTRRLEPDATNAPLGSENQGLGGRGPDDDRSVELVSRDHGRCRLPPWSCSAGSRQASRIPRSALWADGIELELVDRVVTTWCPRRVNPRGSPVVGGRPNQTYRILFTRLDSYKVLS